MINYFLTSSRKFSEIKKEEIKEKLKKKSNFLWINVEKPSEEEAQFIKELLDLHPTTYEDILSDQTRMKYEEFEEYTLIVLKSILEVKENGVETDNISIVLGKNYVLTLTINKNNVVKDLTNNKKKIEALLKKGPDDVAHYILDKEVDEYLTARTNCAEDLKDIEKEFMEEQDKKILKKLFAKEVLFIELRHSSESLVSLCLKLIKPTENYIKAELIPHFRDVYDHAVRTADGYKKMLERIDSLNNMYMSINSLKTNETMKTLTIIMALLLPLTIITGFYGMNVHLPFQENNQAYLGILFAMFLSSVIMVYLSIKQGWIARIKIKSLSE